MRSITVKTTGIKPAIQNEMMHYKHFSFDLWMTLIKSNPSFKKKRAVFFFSVFNPLKKSVEEVEFIFRTVDLMCNAINEKTGKNIDAEEMYLMVIYQLTGSIEIVNTVNMASLQQEMEQLLFENMPVLYDEEIRAVLDKIKAGKGNTLSILSNTAFIKGAALRFVLKQLQVDAYFDFQLYSDEEGLSKPNARFFERMLDNISQLRLYEPVTLKEIVHIGDNINADIAAANAFGIGSYQVHSNDNSIKDLFA